jgi:hypothetical protein
LWCQFARAAAVAPSVAGAEGWVLFQGQQPGCITGPCVLAAACCCETIIYHTGTAVNASCSRPMQLAASSAATISVPLKSATAPQLEVVPCSEKWPLSHIVLFMSSSGGTAVPRFSVTASSRQCATPARRHAADAMEMCACACACCLCCLQRVPLGGIRTSMCPQQLQANALLFI